jgi:hypothetical protein
MSVVDDSEHDARAADGTPTPVEEPTAEALSALDDVLSRVALSFATASSVRIEPLIAEWLGFLADFLTVDRITLYEYSGRTAACAARITFADQALILPQPL